MSARATAAFKPARARISAAAHHPRAPADRRRPDALGQRLCTIGGHGIARHARLLQSRQPRAAGRVRHASPGRPPRRRLIVRHSSAPPTARSSSAWTCSSSPRPTREGRPQCSYKGGEPGFVRVLDEHTLAFPTTTATACTCRWATCCENPHVGLLFIDFERASGACGSMARRRSTRDDPLLAEYPEAQFIVRVRADRGVPELPALHPPHAARRALALRAASGVRDAGPRLEAHRLGARRAASPVIRHALRSAAIQRAQSDRIRKSRDTLRRHRGRRGPGTAYGQPRRAP